MTDPREMEMLEAEPGFRRRTKMPGIARLRCMECDKLGRLQYRSTRIKPGGAVLSLKCKNCGAWRHVSEDKARG